MRRRFPDAPVPLVEGLEHRTMMSAAPFTTTTLRLSAGVAALGQTVTATVTVRGFHKTGKLTGIVEFLDNGSPIQAAGTTLSVGLKHNRVVYKFGVGDAALFNGSHEISAEYISSNSGLDSTSAASPVTISEPPLTTTTNSVGIATLGRGRGKTIHAGQEAQVTYTGFLASNGEIFDYGTNPGHGAGAKPYFDFEVGASPEQVIPGFDVGTLGMKIGQTRVVDIPASQGYGDTQQGLIPPNSELIFEISLEKITRPA